MEKTIQIALVDDHRLFRSGLVALLANLPRYSVLFEASDGEEMIAKITHKVKPDIILLDISMPKMDGIAAAQWVKQNHPDIHVIILSMFKDADKVLAMVKIGVKGYLLKDADPAEFEEALSVVSQNDVYYPNFVAKLLAGNYKQADVIFNSRELEFLRLAATELTYKEIAEQMCVSTRTVDGYRDQLFDKLNLKSRVGLVLYGLKKKLIDL